MNSRDSIEERSPSIFCPKHGPLYSPNRARGSADHSDPPPPA